MASLVSGSAASALPRRAAMLRSSSCCMRIACSPAACAHTAPHACAAPDHHARCWALPVQRGGPLCAAAANVGSSGDDFDVQLEAPTDMLVLLRRMLLFLLPVTALVLSEPLLGLCTSLFIGQHSTSVELAALGPANIVISFTHYVFASIQIATMHMLGRLLRQGDESKAQRLMSSALGLALTCGTLVLLTLTVFPTSLITATGLRDPEVIPLAAHFLQIRAAGQMGVLVTLVCQAAFLAQQDPVAPSAVGVASTLVSLTGHTVLVANLGWGLTGAALSTSACNVLSALSLLLLLNVRGRVRSVIALPRMRDLQALLATMAPLSVKFISKNCCYIVIQTTATSILDVTRLAAHQAIFSAWGFCSFWLAPVEQAVLAMAPAAASPAERRAIMVVGMGLGLFIGTAGGLAVSSVAAFAPQLLTQDPMLWPIVGMVAGQALASMVLTGIDVSSNAVNIVGGDVNYVAQSFVLTLGIVSAFMAACRHLGWGFVGVWNGVVVFFAARALQSGILAVHKHILGAGIATTVVPVETGSTNMPGGAPRLDDHAAEPHAASAHPSTAAGRHSGGTAGHAGGAAAPRLVSARPAAEMSAGAEISALPDEASVSTIPSEHTDTSGQHTHSTHPPRQLDERTAAGSMDDTALRPCPADPGDSEKGIRNGQVKAD